MFYAQLENLDAYGASSERAPELLLDPFVPNSHLLLFMQKILVWSAREGDYQFGPILTEKKVYSIVCVHQEHELSNKKQQRRHSFICMFVCIAYSL